MNGLFVGGGLLLFIIAIYFLSYLGNKSIAAPEGAQVISKCSTCGSGACSTPLKDKVQNGDVEDCEIFEEKIELV